MTLLNLVKSVRIVGKALQLVLNEGDKRWRVHEQVSEGVAGNYRMAEVPLLHDVEERIRSKDMRQKQMLENAADGQKALSTGHKEWNGKNSLATFVISQDTSSKTAKSGQLI